MSAAALDQFAVGGAVRLGAEQIGDITGEVGRIHGRRAVILLYETDAFAGRHVEEGQGDPQRLPQPRALGLARGGLSFGSERTITPALYDAGHLGHAELALCLAAGAGLLANLDHGGADIPLQIREALPERGALLPERGPRLHCCGDQGVTVVGAGQRRPERRLAHHLDGARQLRDLVEHGYAVAENGEEGFLSLPERGGLGGVCIPLPFGGEDPLHDGLAVLGSVSLARRVAEHGRAAHRANDIVFFSTALLGRSDPAAVLALGDVVAITQPAGALDIRSTATPGKSSPAGNPLCANPQNLEINRADRTLTLCGPDGQPSVTTLLKVISAGRKAAEQGKGDDLTVAPSGAPFGRPLSAMTADTVKAVDWGVKADGSTNDTTALQAAINYAQTAGKVLELPGGTIAHAGVTVSQGLSIRGHGQSATNLRLMAGSTAPAITVSVPSSAALANNYAVEIIFDGIQISAVSRDDVSGQGVAHGLALVPGTGGGAYTRVQLRGVSIFSTPGDAIHGAANWKGVLESYGTEIVYPGGYGVSANSVQDWRWYGGEIVGAQKDGFLLSGTDGFKIDGLNVYVNAWSDIHLFNSANVVIANATIDLTGQHGLYVDNRVSGQRVDVVGTKLRWAGSSANATYADLYLAPTNVGDVVMTGSEFRAPSTSQSTNKPGWNVLSASGNTGRVIAATPIITSGSLATYVNDVSKIVTIAANDMQVLRDLTVSGKIVWSGQAIQYDNTQYEGYTLHNGTNAVAALKGIAVGNDNGRLELSSGGSILVALQASGDSFVAGGKLGVGTASPGAQLDVNGTLRGKSLTLSGAPTTTDIPASYWTVVKRTDDGSLKLCGNDSGTIKCATLN